MNKIHIGPGMKTHEILPYISPRPKVSGPPQAVQTRIHFSCKQSVVNTNLLNYAENLF